LYVVAEVVAGESRYEVLIVPTAKICDVFVYAAPSDIFEIKVAPRSNLTPTAVSALPAPLYAPF
jgi:hypothetical protein